MNPIKLVVLFAAVVVIAILGISAVADVRPDVMPANDTPEREQYDGMDNIIQVEEQLIVCFGIGILALAFIVLFMRWAGYI